MATVTIDDGLMVQVEAFLPKSFHGERKSSLRVDWVLREWVQQRQNQEAEHRREPEGKKLLDVFKTNAERDKIVDKADSLPKRTPIQPIDEGRRREGESR